jgi:hypothetical protein
MRSGFEATCRHRRDGRVLRPVVLREFRDVSNRPSEHDLETMQPAA